MPHLVEVVVEGVLYCVPRYHWTSLAGVASGDNAAGPAGGQGGRRVRIDSMLSWNIDCGARVTVVGQTKVATCGPPSITAVLSVPRIAMM